MKIKWNEKYTTISVYSFIVIALSIVFYNIVSEFSSFKLNLGSATSVLQPFVIGFVLAYLFNFILKFIEERGFRKFTNMKFKTKRLLSLLFTYLTVILFVYVFIIFVFPQLASSLMGLVTNLPDYVNNVRDLFEDSSKHVSLNKKALELAADKWKEFLDYIVDFTTDLLPFLGRVLKSTASSLINILLGIVISIYVLIDKENFFGLGKKIVFALFSNRTSLKILELVRRTNYIFGKFISGKILDSFIIGWITFFTLLIFKMPYITLISFIIGVTNIVPFFGPFIGAVPSFLIILFISPVKALWFLVIVLFIQQLEGNLIGPKIL